MSTERIDIELTDKIAPSISTNLQSIANTADSSASSLERLQAQLNSINGNGLNKLQAQMAELASANVTLAATFTGFNQILAPTLAVITKLSEGYAQLAQASVQAAQGQLALSTAMRQTSSSSVAMPTGSPASVRALDTALKGLATTYANVSAASELLTAAWTALDGVTVALTAAFTSLSGQVAGLSVLMAEAGVSFEIASRAISADATAMAVLTREMAALRTTVGTVTSQMVVLTEAVNNVSVTTRAASGSLLNFNNMFKGMIAIQVVKWVVDLIDAYTSLSNRMAVIANANVTVEQSLAAIFRIANETRAPVESLAQVYQQTGIAAKELGATQKETEVFTKAVAEAIAIQGGSATSSRGALIQLSQALGTGKLRAEEFNSMLEGSYTIVAYAAKGIERMGGSVATLRQEVIKGKVSSQEFFNALISQSGNIDEQFAKTAVTITQSLDVMRNRMIEFVGVSHIASDVSQTFGLVMLGLANSIDLLGRSIAALVVGGALFGLVKVYNTISSSVSAVIAANTLHNASMNSVILTANAEIAALSRVQATLAAQAATAASTASRDAATAAMAEALLAAKEASMMKTFNNLDKSRLTWAATINQMNMAEIGLNGARVSLAASTANLARIEGELLATSTALAAQQEIATGATAVLKTTSAWGLLVAKVTEYAAIVVNFVKLNPFIGWAAAGASALGLLYAFSDQIKVSSNGAVTLHDVVGAVFTYIGKAIYYAWEGLKLFVEGYASLVSLLAPNIFQSLTNVLHDLGFKDAEVSLYSFVRLIVSSVDTIVGVWTGMFNVIYQKFEGSGKTAGQSFVEGFKAGSIGDAIFKDLDSKLSAEERKIRDETKKWQDWLKDNASGGSVTAPKAMNAEELKKTVDITTKFNEELDKQLSLLNTYGNARQNLQEIEKLSQKLSKDGLDISKAQRAEISAYIDKIIDYKQVSGMVDQLYNSSQQKKALDYANNVKAISTALDRNLISLAEADAAMNKLGTEYKTASADDLTKTTKTLNDSLEEQKALVGHVGDELIAVTAIRAKEKEVALASGRELNLQAQARIADLAIETEHTKQLNAEIIKLYNETTNKKASDYATQQEAINTALRTGVLTANEAIEATNKLAYAYTQMSLSPVGKFIDDMNQQLDKQKALLGKVGPELAKATALYEAQQKAKASGENGGIVTPEQAQRITDLAAASQLAVLAQDQFNEVFAKSKDPLERFNEKVNKASLMLHDHIITQEGYNRAVRAFERERDGSSENKEAFAIEHMTKKLDDQIQSTKMLGDEKERQQKFDQIKESLDSKHITLTATQTEKIKEQIAAIVEQTHIQQIMETIYKSTEGVMKDYERTQTAVNLLFTKSPQYIHQYTRALDDARMKVLEVNNTVKAGLEHGLLAELKKVGDVTGTVSTFVTGAFNALENSFVNFLKTGKMDWKEFATTVIEMAMKMVTELLILKPIIEAIKASISGAGGIGGSIGTGIAGLMGFATGGEFEVGGSAATDSNVVAFRATAGERVSVMTPSQQRSSRASVNVSIENYGQSKSFDVQQIDESTIRIIARDEADRSVQRNTGPIVAAALRDPNSNVSKTMQQYTSAQRKRG
jgi:lambda family phage tail tape measure protein